MKKPIATDITLTPAQKSIMWEHIESALKRRIEERSGAYQILKDPAAQEKLIPEMIASGKKYFEYRIGKDIGQLNLQTHLKTMIGHNVWPDLQWSHQRTVNNLLGLVTSNVDDEMINAAQALHIPGLLQVLSPAKER